ncbi:MAG: hypothetical protein DHS20C15_20160 [Planctomycetota bacterium]|nr:MAG: hypothetical protein DHS20C15_20160 [Planctomycetota bacterium]
MALSESRLTHESIDELVASARGGCAASFSELVRRHEAPLYRFLVMRTRDPEQAEELCQQSFVRCWRKLHTFRPGAAFSPWLFTLGRNVAANHFRKRTDAPLEEAGDPPSGERGPHDQSSAREERERLWDLAARLLDEAQRSALWLHYAEGMSASEIGGVLERPAAQVRVVLHRARRRLADHLRALDSLQHSEGEPSAQPHGELLR